VFRKAKPSLHFAQHDFGKMHFLKPDYNGSYIGQPASDGSDMDQFPSSQIQSMGKTSNLHDVHVSSCHVHVGGVVTSQGDNLQKHRQNHYSTIEA